MPKKIRRFISAGGKASHQRNDESICQKVDVDVNGNEIKKSVEEDEAEQKIIRNISCTMNRIKVFIYRRNNEREALRMALEGRPRLMTFNGSMENSVASHAMETMNLHRMKAKATSSNARRRKINTFN